MLRGVNKLIVEINNPESDYFERAIFFIKPTKCDIPTIELSDNANHLIKDISTSVRKRKSKKFSSFFSLTLKLAAAAFAGGVATAFIMQVFER